VGVGATEQDKAEKMTHKTENAETIRQRFKVFFITFPPSKFFGTPGDRASII